MRLLADEFRQLARIERHYGHSGQFEAKQATLYLGSKQAVQDVRTL